MRCLAWAVACALAAAVPAAGPAEEPFILPLGGPVPPPPPGFRGQKTPYKAPKADGPVVELGVGVRVQAAADGHPLHAAVGGGDLGPQQTHAWLSMS